MINRRRVIGACVLGMAVTAVAGGCHLMARRDTALAALVSDAVVAAHPGARIISMKANVDRYLACGWADFGGEDGITPVMGYGDVRDPLNGPLTRLVAPRLHQGGLTARVEAAYERQLVLVSCTNGLMPKRPAGAAGDDEVLAALWTTSRPVVIAAPIGQGFVAVRRKPGGGPEISPVFATREAAAGWGVSP